MFVCKLASLTSCYESNVVYLSNVSELTVADQSKLVKGDVSRKSTDLIVHPIAVEPQFVSIGKYHVSLLFTLTI